MHSRAGAGERGRLTHLVGLNQMEVLPVNTEPMFKVPALLLTPGTEPVCKQRGLLSQLGAAETGGEPGLSLTSNHLHVEPQPAQGLFHVEITLHKLIQRLGQRVVTFPASLPGLAQGLPIPRPQSHRLAHSTAPTATVVSTPWP